MLHEHYDAFRDFCQSLGLCDKIIKNIYAADRLRGLSEELDHKSLTFADTQEALNGIVMPAGAKVLVPSEQTIEGPFNFVVVDNPRFIFWSLFEFIERSKGVKFKSNISQSCQIGCNSIISDVGVVIEDDVVIDDGVIIKPGVTIKKGAKIGPGCVIGSIGFEVKDTIFGRIVLTHNGGVLIEENVELGALCTVNQGLSDTPTHIGMDSKIDSCVHIAHSTSIGRRNIIAANVTFGGSVKTGDDIFFGLNSTIKNGIKLANGCFIGASAFVSESYDFSVKLIPRAAKPLRL